ncbi:MAG: hypothetical protein ACRDZ3_12360 [Acidimicrobiia bacterium]
MDRALEGIVQVEASPERVIQILSRDPAGVLTGMPSDGRGVFVAEIAVDLGGGTSLVHEVDVVFGRRPDKGAVRRFGLSWRARDHQGAFPAFGGDLEVHPDGNGSRLRLSGRYSVPFGAVGAFGDRLLGHRVARRSIQGFLEAAAARIDAAVAPKLDAGVPVDHPRTADVPVTIDEVHSELYLG